MRQVLDDLIPLKLLSCKCLHLVAGTRGGDFVRSADDLAVEREHALALEEMVEVEEGFAGEAG